MAWRCSAATNDGLVANLSRAGFVSGKRVEQAMKTIDRKWFVPTTKDPYEDSPQYLGDNATISAPHMHGHALSTLAANLKPGATVLDIGSGSGYLTACMAQMVGPNGLVVGIEHVERLVQQSEKTIQKIRAAGVEMAPIIFLAIDGRNGDPEHAPFDCIHVGAASDSHPELLLQQLKDGGMLYIPEVMAHNKSEQAIFLYRKDDYGHVSREEMFGVRYVPLTSLQQQLQSIF